jgi:hypothetical protein
MVETAEAKMTWLELAAMMHVISGFIGLGCLVVALIWVGVWFVYGWYNGRS